MSIPRDARVDYAGMVDPDAAPFGRIRPGAILAEEFLAPLGLSACALARAIGVPRNRITGILRGEGAITADTALRPARFFGTSPDFRPCLPMTCDLHRPRAALGIRLGREITRRAPIAGAPRRRKSRQKVPDTFSPFTFSPFPLSDRRRPAPPKKPSKGS